MANKELHSVVTINNEEYSITANKVAKKLTIKGNDTEVASFDGSEGKAINIKGRNGTSVSVENGSIIISSEQVGDGGAVLGETENTAYRGDRGKIAYDHSQSAHAPADAEKNKYAFSKIAIGQSTISANKVEDTLTLIAGANITLTPNTGTDSVTISSTGGGGEVNLDNYYNKTEVNNLLDSLISHGDEDPDASISSQYYFKY
jgi:hypothetical protein